MLDNLLAMAHVLDTAHRHGVTKLLYLASTCAYQCWNGVTRVKWSARS